MPVYAYKGVTHSGKRTRGHLDAESARSARARLRSDGITPIEVTHTGQRATRSKSSGGWAGFDLSSLQRVSALDLAVATRQASTLVAAGVPLVAALRALTDPQTSLPADNNTPGGRH